MFIVSFVLYGVEFKSTHQTNKIALEVMRLLKAKGITNAYTQSVTEETAQP